MQTPLPPCHTRALLELRLARCCRLRDGHLSSLGQLAPTLRVLSLERCQALTTRTAEVVTQLCGLLDLNLDDTHLGHVAGRLGHVTGLTRLRLGGLPTRDADCEALAQLTGLRELSLWGSEVGDTGVAALSTLTRLTCLDLSLTAAHAPPPLPCLRRLAMIHCELDLADEGQRQSWLGGGPPVLPALEDLQLHKAAVQLPWGQALLAALVSGAAPALRSLNLSGCNVEDLSLLAAATALRELDLAEARVGPGLLADEALGALALLPLTALNLDRTACTDAGVGQLLAMTGLRQLSLACVGVGDGCWAVLAQLPALEALDLSNSRFSAGLGILPQGASHAAVRAGRGTGRHAAAAGPAAAAVAAAAAGLAPPHPAAAVTRRRSGSYDPPRLASLTSLRMLNTKVDDLGCRRLAPLLPALRSLSLSSSGVSDSGFKTLCEGLRDLRSLEASGLMLTDQGLHAAGKLSALTRLVVSDCWLVSDKEAAAVAARGHVLREVRLNGRPVSPALTPSTSLGRNATLSPRCRTLSGEPEGAGSARDGGSMAAGMKWSAY